MRCEAWERRAGWTGCDLGHDEGDAVVAAGVVDEHALAKDGVGADDEREVGDLRGAHLALQHVDPDVLVQVREAVARDVGAVLPDVGLGAVELGAQVRELHRPGVVEGERLHAGEGEVFGDLYAEAAQSYEQDGAALHAAHGLVPEDVQLAAVQAFIYGIGAGSCAAIIIRCSALI